MRRTLLTFTLLAGLAGGLTGLAGPLHAQTSLAGQKITVLLPPWGTLPKDMTDRFQKETGIKLDLQTLGWDDIRTKVVTSMVAGTAPADVTEVDWSWVGQFGQANWYTPLNDRIDAATVADIPTTKSFRFGGNLLAIPYNNDFRILIYNKKLFEAAGITEPPKTIEELTADARLLKQKGIVTYPIALPLSATEGVSTAWYLLTKAFGGELFGPNYTPLFTDPNSAGYKALAWEIDALKTGLIDPASTGLTDVQIQDEVKNGRAAIDVAGWAGNPATYNDPKQSKVAGQIVAAVMPGEGGKSRTFGLPDALGIPANSEHKDAAVAFIKWWMEPANQIEADATLGDLPTRTSVLETLNKEGKLAAGDVLLAQIPTIGPLFPLGTPPWYPQFSSAVSSSINAAAKGSMTVDQAVQHIAAQAKQAMKQ
jgi:multiple sugar transport system substrate-binding protein